jgi:hypothetical protein
MMRPFVLAAIMSLAALGEASQAAPGASYLGTWRITGSQLAPWYKLGDALSPSDVRHLTDARVTFAARAITAPVPLACKGPHYEVKEVGPDYLFQGSLTDPAAQAKALGYRPKITTLETGCEGLIDFHFIDADTALFGLNNRLYRMERVKRAR